MLTQERVHELLSYDPVSGVFIWLKQRGKVKVGSVAGNPSTGGYTQITIDGVAYMAHRLAWFYVTGEWPRRIDHEDTDRSNNRWGNLRKATHRQNLANAKKKQSSTFALKGVGRGTRLNPFRARFAGTHLGVFKTEEKANAAYLRAAQKAHGEFARG
ncbi:hypothetical protein ABIB86_000454 [Bradyrhizobium sp. JR1.7]|uniref:HNH endonuclease n=1 Tax=unclassified Bradyrhizobium TaxID=2631580 RepID=UPI00339B8345